MFVLFLVTISTAITKTNIAKIYALKIHNKQLAINKINIIKIKYLLSSKAITGAKILNNNITIKTLRKSKLQKKGRHQISWNGHNGRNKLVSTGYYNLKLAVRDVRTKKIRVRKIRIYVKNTTPVPSKPTTEPAPISSAPAPTPTSTEPATNLLFSEYFDQGNGIFADEYINNGLDNSGKWDVTSGELYVNDQSGLARSPIFRVVTTRSDFSDYTLSADMLKSTFATEPHEGLQLFFRYQDPYNLYVVGLRNDNNIHLKKKVGDVYYELAKVPVDSNKLNYRYKMKVVTSSNRIQIFVDGLRYIDMYDNSYRKGKVGIRTDNISARFDNFEVYASNQ